MPVLPRTAAASPESQLPLLPTRCGAGCSGVLAAAAAAARALMKPADASLVDSAEVERERSC